MRKMTPGMHVAAIALAGGIVAITGTVMWQTLANHVDFLTAVRSWNSQLAFVAGLAGGFSCGLSSLRPKD